MKTRPESSSWKSSSFCVSGLKAWRGKPPQRGPSCRCRKIGVDYYRFATEHSNDGAVIIRGDERLYFNRKYMELMGYDNPEELASLPVFSGVHPDDANRVKEYARRRQQGESANQQYECRLIKKDGEIISVEVSSSLIMYQGQTASLGYIRDITERRLAQEALLKSEDMYRNLAETAYDVIATVDLDGIITYINKACRELAGGLDLVGMTMRNLIPKDTVPGPSGNAGRPPPGFCQMRSYGMAGHIAL